MLARLARPTALLPALAFLALSTLPGCDDSTSGFGFVSTAFLDAQGFCGCSGGDIGDFPNTGVDLGRIPDGAFIELQAAIQDPGDEDWFEVEVDLIGSEFLEITLQPSNNEDYDIEVYDAGLNLLPAPPALRGDQTERVSVANYIGDLYVRVFSVPRDSDEDDPYEIRFEVID